MESIAQAVSRVETVVVVVGETQVTVRASVSENLKLAVPASPDHRPLILKIYLSADMIRSNPSFLSLSSHCD